MRRVITLPFYILYGWLYQNRSPYNNRNNPFSRALATIILMSFSQLLYIDILYHINENRVFFVILILMINALIFFVNYKNIQTQYYNLSKKITRIWRWIFFPILLLPWIYILYKSMLMKPF